jgi:hypothetical protein
MKNFYKKLFPVLALQDYSGLDIEEIVLSTFSRMMDILIEESAGLAPEEYVELSFEEFEQAPLAQLEKVYSQLRLDGFDKAEPHFRHYLSSVQGYKKNEYPDNAHDQRLVERHWGKYLDHWGYRPGSSMSAPSEQ